MYEILNIDKKYFEHRGILTNYLLVYRPNDLALPLIYQSIDTKLIILSSDLVCVRSCLEAQVRSLALSCSDWIFSLMMYALERFITLRWSVK